jgi:hypothetical protein
MFTPQKYIGERLQDYGRKKIVKQIKLWSQLDLKYKPFSLMPDVRSPILDAALPREK